MIPVKLQLKNFMSYRESEIFDFTGFDLAILAGDNGVGKSSLLEAMAWTVWGKSRASSDDDLIHQGETSMWVELIFDYEGNRYRVLRSREARGRGATTLEFQVAEDADTKQVVIDGQYAKSWKSLTGATIKQTQDSIIATLKLDYELFINSSYLRQGHADEFTTKIPAERKEILADILDLSLYDLLEEKAKERRRALEAEEELINAQLIELSERVAQKETVQRDFVQMMTQKHALEDQLKKKEATLKSFEVERRRYETVKREIELLRERFEEISGDLKDLKDEQSSEEESLSTARHVLSQKGKIEQQFRALKKARAAYEELNTKLGEIGEVKEKLSVLDHRQAELTKTMERLEHIKVCPTCLRAMSKKEAETIIGKLKAEFDREISPRKKKLWQKLKEIGYSEQEHAKLREAVNKLTEADTAKRELDVAAATVDKTKKLLAAMGQKADKLLAEREKIGLNGKKLAEDFKKLEAMQPRWAALEEEVTALREHRSSLQDTLGGLKDRLSQIKGYEDQIQAKTSKLKDISEKKGLFNDLSVSFGKKGVQAMIIEQAIPQIEEGANVLLQKITGGRMQVKFITQRAKKSDESELMETLDIEIRDELGERPYEQYSGGEAFRINFAIRVALAKLLALRAGAKLRFLVIDEGFGTLDSSGREDIVAAISGIRADFAKILIVTHIEEFKNLFPARVEVTKDLSGSHVQVVTQ